MAGSGCGLGLGCLRRRAPELYFFLYNGGIVFILPYLAILWRDEGLTGAQIGLLSAVRPFIAAISGQLLVGVADARRWHFGITLVTYVVALAARSSMALATGFIAHLLLILASEGAQSSFSIMSDAAIAAATDEAGYGRKRVLASLGWGMLAPVSGLIVGRWGVSLSIAIYMGLCAIALVPTLLLPLRELGPGLTSGRDVEQGDGDSAATAASLSGVPTLSKTTKHLERGSVTALLLPGGNSSAASGDLDSRQHAGHAAELAIELLGVPAKAAGSDAGDVLLGRISSKLAQAQTPSVSVRPLLTTADEDAAEEAASTAAAEAATSVAPLATDAGQDDGGSWSIKAVGSPLAARQPNLPPIACPPFEPSPAGTPGRPGTGTGTSAFGRPPNSTPLSVYATANSALARTTSAATTAFFSVRSGSSMSGVAVGLLLSPRDEPGSLPCTALFHQQSDVGSVGGTAAMVTPRTATGAGQQQQQQQQQQQAGLFKQASNLSQALNGFEQCILEGSISDGAYLTPRAPSILPPQTQPGTLQRPLSRGAAPTSPGSEQGLEDVKAGLLGLPAVHTVHPPHFLPTRSPYASATVSASAGGTWHLPLSDGSERQLRRTSSRHLMAPPPGGHESAKSPLLAALLALPAPAGQVGEGPSAPLLLQSSLSGGAEGVEQLPAVVLCVGGDGGDGDGSTAGLTTVAADDPAAKQKGADLSVWAGIKQLLRNPHHLAFFAQTLFCGIGYGVLGFENLYLKESGAPGLLIGMCLLVSTCGEMPLFATSGLWLPKLGHELALNIGYAGFVLRLCLYILLPLFPSLWLVLPVELLQGLTFAVCYGVGTLHVKAIAPPHLRSTTQSLFFGLYYGVGAGASGLAGGFIYQSWGMRFVFIIGASTLLLGWVVIQLALRWATCHERAQRAAAVQLAP